MLHFKIQQLLRENLSSPEWLDDFIDAMDEYTNSKFVITKFPSPTYDVFEISNDHHEIEVSNFMVSEHLVKVLAELFNNNYPKYYKPNKPKKASYHKIYENDLIIHYTMRNYYLQQMYIYKPNPQIIGLI